jgi:hypothetical protein
MDVRNNNFLFTQGRPTSESFRPVFFSESQPDGWPMPGNSTTVQENSSYLDERLRIERRHDNNCKMGLIKPKPLPTLPPE